MVDNIREKQHLRTQHDILSDIEETNSVAGIIKKSTLDLSANLTNGKDLFVDDDIIASFDNIHNRLSVGTTIVDDANTKHIALKAEEAKILALLPVAPPPTPAQVTLRKAQHEAELNDIRAKIKDLEVITGPGGGLAGGAKLLSRRDEYDKLLKYANYFDRAKPINNIDVDLTVGPPRTGTDLNQALNSIFQSATAAGAGAAGNAEYALCDGQGNPLPKSSTGDYSIQIGGVSATLSGITLAGGGLDLRNLKITPPTVDMSQPLKLSINAAYPASTMGVNNVNLVYNKKFELKLNKGALSDAAQRARYDIFNISGKPIGEYVQDFYNNNYKEVEDKLLDETIGDAATDENRKVLRERIKNLIAGGKKVSPFVKNQKEISKNFKEHFFANRKPTDDDISTTSKFNDFLKKNIPEHLKGYLEQELKRQMESTAIVPAGAVAPFLPATRDLHDKITKEILKYRQEQEEHGRDSFTDSKNLRRKLETNKRLRSPGLTRPWLLGKKDVSYMRFFTNQTQEIGKQKVKLVTDEKKNKIEFTGYDATLKIGSVDNLTMEIKMDNGDEFALKAGNHIALIDSILNEPGIPYGKMRVHMAYNMIKAMIKVANKNNITLEYAVGKDINTLSIDKNDDIVLETVNDTTGVRNRKNLFSEKKFDAENDMHQLRKGLEDCLGQFNKSMDKVHDQYKKATDKRLFGYFSLSRAKFPVGRFDSPIKKLMNIRKNRTINFDFEDTKIEGIDKNISISFSKNVFTITSDLLEKPISSKNFGNLLNTRIDGKRIFDGMERAISGTVYQNMIGNLRKNVKLANTNFGVKDPVKNRIYFLDKSGEVGYISLANNKNPIAKSITRMFKNEYGTIKRLPSTGRIMLTKEHAQKELYQNPFIMGKLMKAMNQRLYSF